MHIKFSFSGAYQSQASQQRTFLGSQDQKKKKKNEKKKKKLTNLHPLCPLLSVINRFFFG